MVRVWIVLFVTPSNSAIWLGVRYVVEFIFCFVVDLRYVVTFCVLVFPVLRGFAFSSTAETFL